MPDQSSHTADIHPPFTFAVIGDLHYGFPLEQTGLELGSLRNLSEVERFAENVGYALEPMAESLKEVSPDFIVHTGDLAANENDQAEFRAATHYLRRLGKSVLFARGDKDDGAAFDQTLLPVVSTVLGRPVDQRYYTAEIGGCHLSFLDTSSWDPEGSQAEWFRSALRHAEKRGGRVFVFGHHPAWTVAKAFYSNRLFCEDVTRTLSEHQIDAYFCGHTHNQNALWHRTGHRATLQFMAAPIGHPDELPTPLQRVQSLLVDPDDVMDCWPGYLENTAPGWFLVRVEEDGVKVSWNHLNRGPEVDVVWKRPGHVERFWQVRHPEDAVLISRDLSTIRRISLRFCAWDAIRPGKRVHLNGIEVGQLPPSARFAPQQIDLPMTATAVLDVINRVEIDAPGVEASTIGNIQLEGVLPGGRIVRTRPTGEVFTWSARWDLWRLPDLQKVMPGRPLRTLLSFQ